MTAPPATPVFDFENPELYGQFYEAEIQPPPPENAGQAGGVDQDDLFVNTHQTINTGQVEYFELFDQLAPPLTPPHQPDLVSDQAGLFRAFDQRTQLAPPFFPTLNPGQAEGPGTFEQPANPPPSQPDEHVGQAEEASLGFYQRGNPPFVRPHALNMPQGGPQASAHWAPPGLHRPHQPPSAVMRTGHPLRFDLEMGRAALNQGLALRDPPSLMRGGPEVQYRSHFEEHDPTSHTSGFPNISSVINIQRAAAHEIECLGHFLMPIPHTGIHQQPSQLTELDENVLSEEDLDELGTIVRAVDGTLFMSGRCPGCGPNAPLVLFRVVVNDPLHVHVHPAPVSNQSPASIAVQAIRNIQRNANRDVRSQGYLTKKRKDKKGKGKDTGFMGINTTYPKNPRRDSKDRDGYGQGGPSRLMT